MVAKRRKREIRGLSRIGTPRTNTQAPRKGAKKGSFWRPLGEMRGMDPIPPFGGAGPPSGGCLYGPRKDSQRYAEFPPVSEWPIVLQFKGLQRRFGEGCRRLPIGGEANKNATKGASPRKSRTSPAIMGLCRISFFRLVIFWIVQNGFRYAMFNPWLEGRAS